MKISDLTNEELCALTVSLLDDNGHEITNPKPTVERIPGMKPDLETRIKTILSQEFRKRHYRKVYDAMEENPDDFNIPDEEPMPQSIHEQPMEPDNAMQAQAEAPVDVQPDQPEGVSSQDTPAEPVDVQPETEPKPEPKA